MMRDVPSYAGEIESPEGAVQMVEQNLLDAGDVDSCMAVTVHERAIAPTAISGSTQAANGVASYRNEFWTLRRRRKC